MDLARPRRPRFASSALSGRAINSASRRPHSSPAHQHRAPIRGLLQPRTLPLHASTTPPAYFHWILRFLFPPSRARRELWVIPHGRMGIGSRRASPSLICSSVHEYDAGVDRLNIYPTRTHLEGCSNAYGTQSPRAEKSARPFHTQINPAVFLHLPGLPSFLLPSTNVSYTIAIIDTAAFHTRNTEKQSTRDRKIQSSPFFPISHLARARSGMPIAHPDIS